MSAVGRPSPSRGRLLGPVTGARCVFPPKPRPPHLERGAGGGAWPRSRLVGPAGTAGLSGVAAAPRARVLVRGTGAARPVPGAPDTPARLSSSCCPQTPREGGGGSQQGRLCSRLPAEDRRGQCPAPAKAGAAFLPRGLRHRWAGDLGVEAHASRWLREGSGMARLRAASCALLLGICASLVATAAGTETMGTMEMGREALLPRPLSCAPAGLLVPTPHAGRSRGPLLPSSSIIPGPSFPTVISCGENSSYESPVSWWFQAVGSLLP